MLRALSLFIITLVSLSSWAGGWDFIPGGGAQEKEFKALLNSGNYRHALIAWTQAYSGSAFGRSENGTATYAFLLYQNGLPFTGLEVLLQQTQPAHLQSDLLKMWTSELKASPFTQKGWIQASGGWKSIINNEIPRLTIKNKKDIKAIFARAEKISADQINARTRLWWQVATLAPQSGDLDSAIMAIKKIKDSSQTAIGQDLVLSTYARLLYQKGDLEGAVSLWNQIPKSSSLWVESVEEKAWAALRKDDFDKALGEVTTLMSGALAPLVGPESYFLSNLMSLKVCDYSRLFKTSELFKKRHRDRLLELQDLANKGTSKNLNAAMERFELNGVNLEAVGSLVSSVPRQSFRDARFMHYMESRRELLTEAKKISDLSAQAAALGGSAELDRLATAARDQSDSLKQLAFQRIRTLAKAEVREYQINLNKMHIIEAEVIERLHLDENLKGQRSKLSKADDKGDVLIFPVTSNETWIDELDNFKARVKDCPTLKGASL